MSVKRYTNGADDDQGTILPFMEESPNGDYVEYADYARLKAEVERLEKEVWRMKMLNDIDGDTIKGLKVALKTDPEWAKVLEAIENNARLEAENRELKAENERLRKAGDVLLLALWLGVDEYSKEQKEKAEEEWNAAKEGKQS